MARGDYLGEFELVVLLGLARLEDEAYGMAIFEEIKRVTGRDLTVPAVYVTLNRLEKKGYVTSRTGDSSAERGGRAKKYYRLTESGTDALELSQSMLSRLWDGVPLRSSPAKS
ncbi:MAG: PadR family transcriptional regulator [Gemmatimonadetes bacterium]|nr:PadR family transcriptional regulator [Gemmatimonadota bacterium]